MIISLIAAVSKNRVIGRNNDLPWKLPDDMKYFMQTTKGHPVIMGRKNFDSLPEKFKPLKDRTNIVLTRNKTLVQGYNVQVVDSMKDALQIAATEPLDNEVFVIGGAQIYALALPQADRLYITEIDAIIAGDTYFPEFDKTQWKEASRIHHEADERHEYAFDFVVYEKGKNT
jgi:dihydrofolate reductase